MSVLISNQTLSALHCPTPTCWQHADAALLPLPLRAVQLRVAVRQVLQEQFQALGLRSKAVRLSNQDQRPSLQVLKGPAGKAKGRPGMWQQHVRLKLRRDSAEAWVWHMLGCKALPAGVAADQALV